MKLISCSTCGVVLDQEKVIPSKRTDEFEEMFYDDEYGIRLENAEWDGDGFLACIECPVCKDKIETDIRL